MQLHLQPLQHLSSDLRPIAPFAIATIAAFAAFVK
jgi:hypothetical protein